MGESADEALVVGTVTVSVAKAATGASGESVTAITVPPLECCARLNLTVRMHEDDGTVRVLGAEGTACST